jgi:hypothetical protein
MFSAKSLANGYADKPKNGPDPDFAIFLHIAGPPLSFVPCRGILKALVVRSDVSP